MSNDNEEWLRRFRLGTMAFIEQVIATAEDVTKPNEKLIEQLPEMRKTLEYFERRVNDSNQK